MRTARWRIFWWALVLGVATAIPVAVSPTWGWLVTLVIGAGGATVVARLVYRGFVEPMERLADVLRSQAPVPDASTEDLARTVAFEYRDAIARLEEALTHGRRREAALANTADAVLLVDTDGRVEYANPTARAMLHNRVLDLTHRPLQPELERLVHRSREFGAPMAEDVTLWVPGAQHARARAVPLADGATVLLLSDLSESYRLDKVRRDFVANVSHELKTPVAGIRVLSEVAATALGDEDRATAQRFIERLEAESRRLADLVSDLLDLSRVEAGGDLEVCPVELDALLAEAADQARPVAEVKGIVLDVGRAGLVTDGDPAQLSMAVNNLVDNAVRYSEGGTVRIGSRDEGDHIAISVGDEGIGIPAEEIPRIFERFYRVDKARSRATGGTGLGLAIVRHVAENHAGRVDVASELGGGSTFTLYLPQRRTPASSSEGSAA